MNTNVKSFLTTPSHRYYYRTIMVNFHYYLPDGNMMVGLHPHANVRTMVAPAEISLLLTCTLDPFLHRCSGCVHPYSPRFSLLLCCNHKLLTTTVHFASILLQGNNGSGKLSGR